MLVPDAELRNMKRLSAARFFAKDTAVRPCNQCGKCCLIYADGGLDVTQEEIDGWKDNAPHIHQYVRGGEIWFSPDTGKRLSRCPWLVGDSAPYSCGIYQDRPADCRSYPVLLTDMIRDECEMIELKDLNDQSRAQEHLDAMRD